MVTLPELPDYCVVRASEDCDLEDCDTHPDPTLYVLTKVEGVWWDYDGRSIVARSDDALWEAFPEALVVSPFLPRPMTRQQVCDLMAPDTYGTLAVLSTDRETVEAVTGRKVSDAHEGWWVAPIRW